MAGVMARSVCPSDAGEESNRLRPGPRIGKYHRGVGMKGVLRNELPKDVAGNPDPSAASASGEASPSKASEEAAAKTPASQRGLCLEDHRSWRDSDSINHVTLCLFCKDTDRSQAGSTPAAGMTGLLDLPLRPVKCKKAWPEEAEDSWARTR
ncbi:uncharacterized protein N7477_006454 [Penicillium maclennaniae]|uniref:uncharacterized protein n=1 Tax=Penicillium maclennaniae TaxID=1343394 RepID=UPI0025403E65|nr:uncharacterized protein N7477_006454 [Penicillium maclennaniae]KAJ5667884.1 hypothetical protein N7477_006454 [Penicillium maclennaniae]